MPGIRIKICGVTNPEDARLAAEFGADAVGLNFYPQSPRYLIPERAAAVVRALPAFTSPVGVFVGLSIRQACAIGFQLGLRALQTYSDSVLTEDPFPFAWIPSYRVKDAGDLAAIRDAVQMLTSCGRPPAAVLIDSFSPGVLGGSGQVAPWQLIRDFDPGVPVILAGGLTPENVAEAVLTVRPWGIDVASGVESAPGVKDADKLKRFIRNAREAAANLETR